MPPLPMLPIWFALLFIPLFLFCEREVGDGEKGLVRRSVAFGIAIVAGGALGFLLLGPPFFFLGLLWAAWRSTGFWDGSLAPEDTSARLSCAVRYLLWLPFAFLAYWDHTSVKPLLIALAIAAAVTFSLRVKYGLMVRRAKATYSFLSSDFNATIERASGAAFGAAIAFHALWQSGALPWPV